MLEDDSIFKVDVVKALEQRNKLLEKQNEILKKIDKSLMEIVHSIDLK